MRVFLANSISALVHLLALAGLALIVPHEDWFELENSLSRGEPIVVQMSIAAAETQLEEVEIKILKADPPRLLHEPPPPSDLVETTPTTNTQPLPKIDVVPTGKEPLREMPDVERTESTATEPITSQTPQEKVPPKKTRPEAKPIPTDQQPKKTPRSFRPAPILAQSQTVAMPFQTATAVGANVDELPRTLPTNLAPAYPTEALLAGIEGRVMIRALIAASGAVETADIEASSGSGSLDDAAFQAVRRWRFTPARRAGTAVAHEVVVPVRFSIRRG